MIVSVYATFADEEEARRIGRQILEERLAACINILGPCQSIYRWNGKLEEAGEVAAIFKTRAAIATDLVRRIGELHSYEVPAAVIWPIEGANQEFQSWVIAETSEESGDDDA
ncbi:MAG: divalent-cation tolerance protein CutA [Sphingosinicella sp.]|nr:divalent-cation tolerance protein CutA [Sphingosinicella sp.]